MKLFKKLLRPEFKVCKNHVVLNKMFPHPKRKPEKLSGSLNLAAYNFEIKLIAEKTKLSNLDLTGFEFSEFKPHGASLTKIDLTGFKYGDRPFTAVYTFTDKNSKNMKFPKWTETILEKCPEIYGAVIYDLIWFINKDKKRMKTEITFKEIEFEVEFDYQPDEAPYHHRDGENYPGCAASIEFISKVEHKGTDFIPFLDEVFGLEVWTEQMKDIIFSELPIN